MTEIEKLTKEQLEIVKREHPEWFNRIEVGKWYFKKYGEKSSIMFFCQGHRNGNAYGYGIDTLNNGIIGWFSDDAVVESNNNGFREAAPEEVKQALIAEAKRRYKDVKNIGNDFLPDDDRIAEYGFSEFHYEERENRLYSAPDGKGGLVVFDCGQWASVISQEKPSLQDDIQALRDRWPDINFTIIAEEKK